MRTAPPTPWPRRRRSRAHERGVESRRVRALAHRAVGGRQVDDRARSSPPSSRSAALLVERLDGDVVREHLSKGLGFSKADRDTNIERIGWVASRLARAGAAVVVSAISPYEEARRRARALIEVYAPFVEVHVATSLEECARRDPKGLYAMAYAGEIARLHRRLRPLRGARPIRSCGSRPRAGRPRESAAVVLARLAELGLPIGRVAA